MRTLLTVVCLVFSCSVVVAQTPTFDMAPERKELTPDPSRIPEASGISVETDEVGEAEAQPVPIRYLMEEPTLRLQGETAVREWSIGLTPAQAASPAEFVFTYSNSIVVAPESSLLSVEINGTTLLEESPRGAEREQRRVVKVPSGTLVSGGNRVRIEARQTHRTDCTINSTFELWTDVSAENTYLSFAAQNANRMTSLRDIVAVGTDTTGLTRFHMIMPSMGSAEMADIALRLSQKLAIASDSESPFFSFGTTLPEAVGPGEMIVAVGVTEDISRIFPGRVGSSDPNQPRFLTIPGDIEAQALVLSAPDLRSLKSIIDDMNLQGLVRQDEVPFVAPSGATRFSFADLGVTASQFFGRRFVTSVKLGMPADFYASNYGVARILLDAAYSSDVLPGGSFNVIVNGELGTTVPITTAGGAVLQKYPIRIPMRHLTPGINTIGFEAILPTQVDNSCIPGTDVTDTPRFALFGTSELIIPNFAHAERAPDLAAWSAFASPLGESESTLDLSLARYDELTLSAAATVMAKLARSAGAVIDFQLVAPEVRAQADNVIFIGVADRLPAELLDGVVLTAVGDSSDDIEQLDNENLELWNNRITQPRLLSWFSNVGAWFKESFDLDASIAFVWSDGDSLYNLPSTIDTLFYQTVDAETGAIRTIVSAASDVQLVNGAEAFARQANWAQIRGVVSYHDILTNEIVSIEPSSAQFLSVRPLTFTNLRLVLTNWLASHFILYALLLLLSAVAAGFATNKLLGVLGRSHEKHK